MGGHFRGDCDVLLTQKKAWLTWWSWRWKLRTADPPRKQLLWWRRAGSRLSSGLWSQRSGTLLNTSHGSLSPSARHSFKWKSDTEAYSLRLLTDIPERTHACLELKHQHSPLVLLLCFDVWSSGKNKTPRRQWGGFKHHLHLFFVGNHSLQYNFRYTKCIVLNFPQWYWWYF